MDLFADQPLGASLAWPLALPHAQATEARWDQTWQGFSLKVPQGELLYAP